jgi:hypothetical protein
VTQKTDPQKTGSGPDFLCIGMQKAGTTFIHECLQNLNGFQLPLYKEIHHFDKPGGVRVKGVSVLRKIGKRLQLDVSSDEALHREIRELQPDSSEKRKFNLAQRSYPLNPVNVEFLKKFSNYNERGGRDEDYLDLFSPYQEFITGDVTPAYSTLDHEAIRRARGLMPWVKIILCVRDPVSRLWSQLNMHLRKSFKNRFKRRPEAGDESKFYELLSDDWLADLHNRSVFMKRSLATQTHEKWVDVFGEENVLVVNFEDSIHQTEPVLDKTCDFFGMARQDIKVVPRNRKGSAFKLPLDDDRRAILTRSLGDEVENYAALFETHRDRV